LHCKVSIIVPVFNAELFMAPCIESLLKQTLRDCEFIFVNDGSSDNSRTILDQFQASDLRIKVFHQENQGVSMARNAGIAAATGDFIGFVDSDDTVEPDMFERLYRIAMLENCDIVVSNFECEMGIHRRVTSYSFPTNTRLDQDFITRQVLPHFLKADDLNTVCTKLYKAAVIREANLTFPEKVALGEDGYFNIRFFSTAQSMIYLDYTGYHYIERAGSATRNIGEKDYFKRALEVYESNAPVDVMQRIDPAEIPRLKAIRLINTVLSMIHIYFAPSLEVGFRSRYRYIRKALSHRQVREALPEYYRSEYAALGRYQKLMVDLIRLRMTAGLYAATVYSKIRSK
jgi:glycosyltransferase involved in cell wall biosynthesis